jgi:hypothetical protein
VITVTYIFVVSVSHSAVRFQQHAALDACALFRGAAQIVLDRPENFAT